MFDPFDPPSLRRDLGENALDGLAGLQIRDLFFERGDSGVARVCDPGCMLIKFGSATLETLGERSIQREHGLFLRRCGGVQRSIDPLDHFVTSCPGRSQVIPRLTAKVVLGEVGLVEELIILRGRKNDSRQRGTRISASS